MSSDILLVTDSINGVVDPLTAELISFSTKHARIRPGSVTLVVPGWNLAADAEKIAAQWGIEVVCLQTGKDQNRNPLVMEKALLKLIDEKRPALVCFLHTMRGVHLAALLSVRRSAACITAVQGMKIEGDSLLYERGVFNGLLLSQVRACSSLAFLTILQGAFVPEKEGGPTPSTQGRVTLMDGSFEGPGMEILEIKPAGEKDTALEEADVIVAAGRGIGALENLSLIRELAAIFPRGAVAGSKPLCDLRWVPYSRQVGATGKSVSPRLYIACGISGALQHITGMKNSRWVVAINKDPSALIFSHADYGIVEDLMTFIPVLLETFQKKYRRERP